MKAIVRLCLAVAVGAAVINSSGCGSNTKIEARSTTVGQELQDLEEARNKGLITEADYNKQRQSILNRK